MEAFHVEHSTAELTTKVAMSASFPCPAMLRGSRKGFQGVVQGWEIRSRLRHYSVTKNPGCAICGCCLCCWKEYENAGLSPCHLLSIAILVGYTVPRAGEILRQCGFARAFFDNLFFFFAMDMLTRRGEKSYDDEYCFRCGVSFCVDTAQGSPRHGVHALFRGRLAPASSGLRSRVLVSALMLTDLDGGALKVGWH